MISGPTVLFLSAEYAAETCAAPLLIELAGQQPKLR